MGKYRRSAGRFFWGVLKRFWAWLPVLLLDVFDLWERYLEPELGPMPPSIVTALWAVGLLWAAFGAYHELRMVQVAVIEAKDAVIGGQRSTIEELEEQRDRSELKVQARGVESAQEALVEVRNWGASDTFHAEILGVGTGQDGQYQRFLPHLTPRRLIWTDGNRKARIAHGLHGTLQVATLRHYQTKEAEKTGSGEWLIVLDGEWEGGALLGHEPYYHNRDPRLSHINPIVRHLWIVIGGESASEVENIGVTVRVVPASTEGDSYGDIWPHITTEVRPINMGGYPITPSGPHTAADDD